MKKYIYFAHLLLSLPRLLFLFICYFLDAFSPRFVYLYQSPNFPFARSFVSPEAQTRLPVYMLGGTAWALTVNCGARPPLLSFLRLFSLATGGGGCCGVAAVPCTAACLDSVIGTRARGPLEGRTNRHAVKNWGRQSSHCLFRTSAATA